MIFYIFQGYQEFFHSDSAVKVLLAREIVETGQYFPSDWNYVNNDLLVFFGHTFIIPLLSFMPAGYLSHAISGLISAGLLILGTWLMTSLLELKGSMRLIVLTIVCSGISGLMCENLLGQVSYGAMVYTQCLVIWLAWEMLRSEGLRKIASGVCLSVMLVLIFWQNPQRASVYYGLPLLAGSIYYVLAQSSGNSIDYSKRRKSFYLMVTLLSCFGLIGFLLNSMNLTAAESGISVGHLDWLSCREMIRNARFTLMGILSLLGGYPPEDLHILGITRTYEWLRFLSALGLVCLIPIALRKALSKPFGGSQFLAIFGVISLGCVTFIHITTTVPDMSEPIQSSRYLIPPLFLLLILFFAHPTETRSNLWKRWATLIIAIVLMSSGYANYVKSDIYSRTISKPLEERKNPLKRLKDFMVEDGLRYGYATYWNAGAISVMSDEMVLVRQIVIVDGLPVPKRHLSSNRWYLPESWIGETFLLLTKEEAGMVDWNQIEYHNGRRAVREIHLDNFRIYVFEENLAKSLPGWGIRGGT